MLAANLQDAYQAQIDTGAQPAAGDYGSPDGRPGLTRDVKQAVADEVQRQLALERTEAQTVAQSGSPERDTGAAAALAEGSDALPVLPPEATSRPAIYRDHD